jgi:hypothetical protein
LGKVRRRVNAIRLLERFAAALLAVNIAALCGCMALPEGASCTNCKKSFPHNLSLNVPWLGGEKSPAKCCSTCELAEGEHTTCDDVPHELEEEAAEHAAEESLYHQVVDRFFVQTASTVVFSTASMAGSAFGTIANYCLPASALGPPDMSPPGRFHPVPTRPVFANRG